MRSNGPESRATRQSPPSIFLVDDDPALRHALTFSLTLEGYRIRAFAGASELLAVSTFPNEGCIILGHALPDTNGLEVLARLRARNVQLPAILVTTEPSGELRVHAARGGIPLIEKPLLTEALFQCIRALLAEAKRNRS